jgi:hypothetical protein
MVGTWYRSEKYGIKNEIEVHIVYNTTVDHIKTLINLKGYKKRTEIFSLISSNRI